MAPEENALFLSFLSRLESARYRRDISAQVYLAPTYLCTLFKEETGSTINAYLTHQRMLYAARLLSTGRYRVYELARRLGYSDVKYFSSLFKRYLGQSPSRYGDGAGKEDADEAP